MILWILYSLIACACLIFCLRPLALRYAFVDEPSKRKQHSGNIPLIGGVAIYLTLFSAILLFLPMASSTIDLLLALTVCVMIGGYDDKFDMNPKIKFFLQLGIAIFLAYKSDVQLHYFGNLIGFGPLDLGLFSGPVAIFSMIVGMNAFNMLDGIDGLSASLALVCILAMTLITGSQQIELIGVVMVAALSVFLVFNLGVLGTKYKIFLGDNGSMTVGLVIAWFLIVASQKASPDFKPVTAIWLIAIPLIDMTSVMFKRLRRGESMLSADREHLHHKFMDLGFSPRATLLIIVSISIITIGIGYALDFSDVPEYIGFYVFLALLILYNLLQAKLFKQNTLSSK